MTSEQLESLVLDRELGELSPAVVALLADYLARDPAAARRAAEISATVQLARRATRVPLPAAPPLDLARLERAAKVRPPIWRRTEFYRLAACLALGLTLGWSLRPMSAPALPNASLPALVAYPDRPAEPRSHFWSIARLTPHPGATLSPPAASRLPRR